MPPQKSKDVSPDEVDIPQETIKIDSLCMYTRRSNTGRNLIRSLSQGNLICSLSQGNEEHLIIGDWEGKT